MGRGRTAESAKKRRIQEERKRRNQSRICLGVHFDRFNSLRENTESSKSDVIKHLLDVHDQFCDCSNVQTRDTDHHELTWSISTSGTPPLPITPGPDFSTPVCDQVDTPGTFRVGLRATVQGTNWQQLITTTICIDRIRERVTEKQYTQVCTVRGPSAGDQRLPK
ncbi:uncharacterized protein LOC124285643 [Haliotis rubra]|uniref:uncharacterized protein LOC124285643 n=1 Tax=Haliotis rubra TaxID=36100 RepID=UPI001EE5DC97|nr:uncharacterized protein LOC124285643 [Haliotis rubra]